MGSRILKFTLTIILVFAVFSPAQSVMAFAEDNTLKYYIGSPVNAGKDTGYSKSDVIKSDDPHYGWTLGSFFVSGYTSVNTKYNNDGSPVFLKNVGDTVSLWFNLEQDIDCLNGDNSLSISTDKNGYDVRYGIEKTNFGRGTLIIRHTDYQNRIGKPTVFTDYLSALEVGADTRVDLFEEGDYEVSLDYEIEKTLINIDQLIFWKTDINLAPTYTNYHITFRFSVRNGNCMVFPFDVKTKSELANSSATPNGFYLDLAKSRYLDISIKREVLTDGNNGLAEDIRFNRPAKDGDRYTDEGIYTITVKNKYTDEKTIKVIYVGTNEILKAYAKTGLSIAEIQKQLAMGATIAEDGTIIAPTGSDTELSASQESTSGQSYYASDTAALPTGTPSQVQAAASGQGKSRSSAPIVVGSLVIVLAAYFVLMAKKKKEYQETINTPIVPDPEEYTEEEIERLSSNPESEADVNPENDSEASENK